MADKHLQEMLGVAESAARLCYPFLEVVIYRLPKGEELAVFNRLGSNTPTLNPHGPRIDQLSDGRRVKSLARIVEDEGGHPIYLVSMRYDLSLFADIRTRIDYLFQGSETAPQVAGGEELMDAICHRFEAEHNTRIAAMTRAQKRDLVYQLHQGGVFDFKEGASLIANRLCVSRATVYNYLNWAQTVHKVSIHQVDAFTTKRFGGNPANVVLDAETLDDEMMGKIAREMNLSETTFVLPSHKANFRLRYFAPSGEELVFCGHSTVGALYMLAREKRYGMDQPGSYRFSVETQAGILPMNADIAETEEVRVAFETPRIRLQPSHLSHEKLCEALGIERTAVDEHPVMFEQTNRVIYLAIRGLKTLGELVIDQRSAEHLARSKGIVTYCLLTRETFDPANTAHMRCFAPLIGIPEDPFTGSALGGLAAYLLENGMIPTGTMKIGSEQGHFVKRPGRVEVTINCVKDQMRATIHAHAVHLYSTEIHLR